MAFVEIELADFTFQELTLFLLSMSTIPFPLLDSLGSDRLISGFEWIGVADAVPVQLDSAPAGYTAPAGTLAVSARLNVHHVSIAELDAGSAGSVNAGTAWLAISNPLTGLKIDLIGLDLDGKAPVRFLTAPVTLLSYDQIRKSLGSSGAVGIYGSIFFHVNGIVTLRYANGPDDNLQQPPANHLQDSGQAWGIGYAWLIRIDGGVFVSELLNNTNQALNPAPKGIVVEDAPTAQWNLLQPPQNSWGVAGQFGIKKIDACPTAFGNADISAAVDARLWFASPDPNQPIPSQMPTQFTLGLSMQAEPSDWDVFRCYAGNLGLGSVLLTIVSPLAGILVGLGSFIGLDEYVFITTGSAVTGQATPSGWQKIDPTDSQPDYVEYQSDPFNLPTFPNGTLRTYAMNEFGLITAGSPPLIAPLEHTVVYTPANGQLPTDMNYVYSCRENGWVKNVMVQSVTITDSFQLSSTSSIPMPVKVFPTSTALPANYWTVLIPDNEIVIQTVQIAGADDVPSGSVIPGSHPPAGSAYIHTSAGIKRFDIDAVPAKQPPSGLATTIGRLNCLRFAVAQQFLEEDMAKWLVDPPAYDYGSPAVRQWQLSFGAMLESSQIGVQPVAAGTAAGEEIHLRPGATDEGGNLELVTDGATELRVTFQGASPKGMRMYQRWLLPTQIIELGRSSVQQLARAGTTLAVRQANGLVSVDLTTGQVSAHKVTLRSLQAEGGVLVGEDGRHRYEFDGGRLRSSTAAKPARKKKTRESKPLNLLCPPASVNLPDGRVAAIWGQKLVLAEPWQKPGN